MRINTNISAMDTLRNLNAATTAKSDSLAKLSSGSRINKAGDDAAGLAISENMKSQISGMTQATRNAQDGVSLIQTAEGALSESQTMIERMRDLSVQSANSTLSDSDRQDIQKEFGALQSEITRVSQDTEFNNKSLLSGNNTFTFQIGANAGQTLSVSISDMSADSLKVGSTALSLTASTTDIAAMSTAADTLVAIDTSTVTTITGALTALGALGVDTSGLTDGDSWSSVSGLSDVLAKAATLATTNTAATATQKQETADTIKASQAITALTKAVSTVSGQRADLGAAQNRLTHTINNLGTTSENLSDANSQIRDVDMASEMTTFTKQNILTQAATSMLSQANSMPNTVLTLLQS
ncbi:flagellin N-terminal helical domain-containing protein [Liquorilactobacillus mali]|nr:flagellin [Liquorilactobacillus mali]AJA34067.1 flagellin [Liquorilactobacillus mali KCTC 3596 = DSM 20444]EJF02242.1 flagellin [Liquorilactobacillus mali KCTC 3596 = DSM 20444]MDV7757501.1 flagellin [Liquorilactobacillus mali]QFQ75585.1 flagellin [Liquorilactobacillus mali]